MIKAFDKSNLRDLRDDMSAALLQVAQKHNILIIVGNARFEPSTATFKLELATKPNDGSAVPQTKANIDFKRYCGSFGLKPEHLGSPITHGGVQYKLAGLKPRAPKRPIVVVSMKDGKTYILPESSIATLQSVEHRRIYGIRLPGELGQCNNQNAFDTATMKPKGKCTNPATTHRKGGGSIAMSYCADCASLMDDAMNELRAEAAGS